jgi:Flp pilus assembly protein TadD
MAENSGLAEFKQGISLLRDGHSSEALEYLRRASQLKQQNPYYLSFLGVAMARAERNWSAALELCKTAASMRRNEAQLYVNLAEVYVSAERRNDAVETLDTALKYCGADARITRIRAKLGRRSSPVLPFLDRGNALNRSLGRLRNRVWKRIQGSGGSSRICQAGAQSR